MRNRGWLFPEGRTVSRKKLKIEWASAVMLEKVGMPSLRP
jgi:hypothetical protein